MIGQDLKPLRARQEAWTEEAPNRLRDDVRACFHGRRDFHGRREDRWKSVRNRYPSAHTSPSSGSVDFLPDAEWRKR